MPKVKIVPTENDIDKAKKSEWFKRVDYAYSMCQVLEEKYNHPVINIKNEYFLKNKEG